MVTVGGISSYNSEWANALKRSGYKMDDFLGLVNWGEMIWFTVITMIVHTGVTVLLFLFYEIIEIYSLFEDARTQKTPVSKHCTYII